MKIVVLLFYLIPTISISSDNFVNIYGNNFLIVKEETPKIKETISSVFELFNLKVNKQIDIELVESHWGYNISSYNPERILIGYFPESSLNHKIIAHELTHYIVKNYFNNHTLLNSFFMEELLADYIAESFNHPEGLCESKMNRLSYKTGYFSELKERFFSHFYRQQAISCCELEESRFCQGLNLQTQVYSLESLAIYNPKIYPLEKGYIETHYIGIPVVQYLLESKVDKKEFISEIIDNDVNLSFLLKKKFFIEKLWNEYNLDYIEKLE